MKQNIIEQTSQRLSPPVGVTGLTSSEARTALIAGYNILVPESSWTRWKSLLGPLTDPMVLLLLIASPIYFSIGDVQDAVVTLVAILPIIAVGWVLESRAHRTLKKLQERIARHCLVLRDGQLQSIPSTHLVVGDVMLLHEGDVVSADLRMMHDATFYMDESSVTGESEPIPKSLTAGHDILLAGTTVLSGRAYCEVTATGMNTQYATIGALLSRTTKPKTPLQRSISRLLRLLVMSALVFACAVVLVERHHGQSWSLAMISGISLLIAVMPEEFPIVYSLYLSLGAWQLSKEHALVRDLPGVETLGSVTVICTDKTGTLTTGQLTLDAVHSQTETVDALLRHAVLACEQTPFDPLDQAIIRYAKARGEGPDMVRQPTLLLEYPFDSSLKRVTHVWQHPDGQVEVVSKGTFEGLVELNQLSTFDKANYVRIHNEFASQGMRVLAVASGVVPLQNVPIAETSRTMVESHLTICGLIAFRDPPRENVPASLDQCRQAGIRIIMITGDHPDTALAIAESIGLTHQDGSPAHVRQGADLDNATDEERDFLILDTDVFARTQPTQKHYLVESLRRQGEVVAMTGDGVNDAAALRAAHIGVAMGKRGTDVAREAATLVLLDDDFSTIVSATRNGRRIYDNLSMAFAYLIAIHVPLALVGLVIPLLGLPLLLLPIQLILLEILVHPIVALVFEAQPAAPNVMQRPPRDSRYALTWETLKHPFAMGMRLSLALIASYSLAIHWGWAQVQARGMGFATLLLVQPFLILAANLRKQDGVSIRQSLTVQFTVSYVAIGVVTLLSMYWASFRSILRVSTFPTQGWILIGASLLFTIMRMPRSRLASEIPPAQGIHVSRLR